MTQPLALSFSVAALATALATALALMLGVVTAHRRMVWLDALLTAPLVLPPTVLGYALLATVGRSSTLGRGWELLTGRSLAFSFSGLVLAATVTSFPLVLQSIRAALESVDPTLQQAARTLGATPLEVAWRVTIPLAARGVAAGVVLGFARALGDFGVTLMIGGNLPGETRTAALAIYDAFLAGDDETARQLALVMTAIAVGLVATTLTLARSRRHD